jgi:steroid delta-isomerase-like uncharacterized protein
MHRRVILERAAEFIAAWNRGDADGVVAHAAEDLLWRDIAVPMPVNGRDALKTLFAGYMAAFPDQRVAITSQTVEGPRVAQEWTATGTHRGELMGISPTGRASQLYGVTVTVYDEDGWLIEGSTYWNPLVLMHQLGVVMPPPEPAGVAR